MTIAIWRAAPLFLVGALAACSTVQVSQENTTAQAETRSTGFLNLATRDDVEVRNPKAFADLQQVIIGGFKVGFNESKTVSGSSRLVAGKTTGEMMLEGVDAQTRQHITDLAYADFVRQLQAQGYQIVARETFTGHPAYAKLSEHDFPFRDDQSALFSSYGVGNYYSPTALGARQVFFPDEIPESANAGLANLFRSTPGRGLSAIGLTAALQEFTVATGIPVINVLYLVDFAAGSSAGFSVSQLKLGQLLSVDHAIIGLTAGAGGTFNNKLGRLNLGQPVPSQQPFATMEDKTTTVTKIAEGANNLFFKGGILGAAGIGGDHTRTYVFRADAARFSTAAQDALNQTTALMLGKMASLR